MLKLKIRAPELVIGVLLTVAIFAIGMMFESSRNQPASTQANPKTEQIHATNQPESFSWNWLTRDGVVFFTFILCSIAAVQAGLFLWQLKLMRDGMDDARKVAKATEQNTRAAIALQLPFLRIDPVGLSHHIQNGAIESCRVHFIDIMNQGATRAFPIEILYGYSVGTDLPNTPFYQFSDKFPLNIVIEPSAPAATRKFLTSDYLLEHGQWADICKGNFIWFYCDLIYEDFMGETRHRSYCWRWAYIGNGVAWREDQTPAYNRKS